MSGSEFLLEVKKLDKSYADQTADIFKKSTTVRVLKDVSFKIRKGEVFGLVGESGCGKSTLGRSIAGLVKDTAGDILFDGQNINEVKDISSKIQIVFQDPLSSLNPRKRIGWILEEPLRIHKQGNREERVKHVNKILELIGLDSSYRDRYPHELSGGQRQRISIGCALMLSPDLIIADEPVSALDVSVQSQILNLMTELHERLKLSYLFISHNLNVVYYMCDRVAVMYMGRIVEFAAVDELYDNPVHPYTQALLTAIPDMESGGEDGRSLIDVEVTGKGIAGCGCEFCSRCPKAAEICRLKAPGISNISGGSAEEHLVRCHITKTY